MRALLMFLLAGLACPAGADTAATSGGGSAECFCTDSEGGRVELEREICLTVNGRAFIARCEMSLNVPIWRDTGRACLHSLRDFPLEQSHPAADPGGIDAQVAAAEHQV